jgi:methionine synthase II (cobalamin-independent)
VSGREKQKMRQHTLLPTTVVGSYPQPDWLIDREKLSAIVPRTRVPELWRIPGRWLEQAQDDATVVAIHDMERAGVDIISDGEIRRESYSNKFANALAGLDREREGKLTLTNAGRTVTVAVPLFAGPVRRLICFGYAAVVPQKPSSYAFLTELESSIVKQISIEAAQPRLDLAVLRELPSKTMIVGVLDLGDRNIETPGLVASRIEAALKTSTRARPWGAFGTTTPFSSRLKRINQ